MSFEKPYYFVAMVFSPLWEGPKWLEVALDANFASIRLDADQSKRFGLAQMQLTIANDQQKTWYLAWRDEQGKWAIGIHDTALQKQLQRTPPPALASQLSGATPSVAAASAEKPSVASKLKITLPVISSKTMSKIFFVLFVVVVLALSMRDRMVRWATAHFVALDVAQEVKVGEEVYRTMYKELGVVNDPFLQSLFEEASKRLTRGATYSYAWVVIKDEKSLDIDVIPGGIMLVPTGLLRRIESLDELYGVMANRMLLLEQRAVMQELVAAGGWPVFWSLFQRQYSVAAKQFIPFIRGFIYSQQTQMLADRPAFVRLWILNIDPKKWTGFLEREAAWQKKDPILRVTTEPITQGRIAYLKEIDTRKPPTTRYIPADFNWAEVKEHLPPVGPMKVKPKY